MTRLSIAEQVFWDSVPLKRKVELVKEAGKKLDKLLGERKRITEQLLKETFTNVEFMIAKKYGWYDEAVIDEDTFTLDHIDI